MEKVRVREMIFNAEGDLLREDFPMIMSTETRFNMVDKKEVFKDLENGKVVYRYMTTNLNTIPEEISDRYIVDPFRVYIYELNVENKTINLVSRENNGGIMTRMSIKNKLKGKKVYYSYDDDRNIPYSTYGNPDADIIDNIVIVSDHTRMDDISLMFRDIIDAEYRLTENRAKSLIEMRAATASMTFKVEPHSMLFVENSDVVEVE